MSACETIESHVSLQDFAHEYLLRTGRRCYLVIQNHQLVGLITPIAIRRVDRGQWPQTSVQSVMRPLKEIPLT